MKLRKTPRQALCTSHLPQITEREIDVWALITQGLSRKEMAERLGVSPKTVDSHHEHLRIKLCIGPHQAQKLLLMGLKFGLSAVEVDPTLVGVMKLSVEERVVRLNKALFTDTWKQMGVTIDMETLIRSRSGSGTVSVTG